MGTRGRDALGMVPQLLPDLRCNRITHSDGYTTTGKLAANTTTLQVTPIADYHVLQFQPQRVQSP
ncbi:MAG: hypothetical protein ACP5I8_13780, partial [Phycisphaerae bacterium]